MNIGIIIAIAVLGLWGISLFFGALGGMSKTFSNTSPTIDSSSLKSQQEKTIQETKERQQKLMEDIKQKMLDSKKY